MEVEKTLDQVVEAIAKSDERRIMFINQVLLSNSALFGLIVGLHDKSKMSNHAAFATSVVLLLLGILLLCIGLFGYVVLQDKLKKALASQALILLNGGVRSIISVSISKGYAYCERAAYIVLICALLSMVYYAIH